MDLADLADLEDLTDLEDLEDLEDLDEAAEDARLPLPSAAGLSSPGVSSLAPSGGTTGCSSAWGENTNDYYHTGC